MNPMMLRDSLRRIEGALRILPESSREMVLDALVRALECEGHDAVMQSLLDDAEKAHTCDQCGAVGQWQPTARGSMMCKRCRRDTIYGTAGWMSRSEDEAVAAAERVVDTAEPESEQPAVKATYHAQEPAQERADVMNRAYADWPTRAPSAPDPVADTARALARLWADAEREHVAGPKVYTAYIRRVAIEDAARACGHQVLAAFQALVTGDAHREVKL